MWRWVAAIVTGLVFMLVASIIRYRAGREPFRQGILGDIEMALASIRRLPMLAVALFLASRWLEVTPSLQRLLLGAVAVGIGVQAGISAVVVARRWLHRYVIKPADDSAGSSLGVLGTIAETVIWTIILLTILSNLGINISGLVASLGVGGIAIALAAQNVLGDLFASLSIVLDKPFQTGDFIKVGNELGVVRQVGLKTTRVVALQGEELVFSNADLLGSRIQNFKKMRERRVVLEFGLLYQTSLESLRAVPGIVKNAVLDTPGCRFDRAHFRNFGDSALMFEAVYYVDTNDYTTFMDRQEAINLALLEELRRRDLDIAFPTRTLHIASSVPAAFSARPD